VCGCTTQFDFRLRHNTSPCCGPRDNCQPDPECVAALPDTSSRAEAGCFKPSALRYAVTVPLCVSSVALSNVTNTLPSASGPKRSTRTFELSHEAWVRGCQPAAVRRRSRGMYFLNSGRSRSYHFFAEAQYGSFEAASSSKKPGQTP
jgi:hypothetical protein